MQQMLRRVLGCNPQQAQQMVRQMYGGGGQRGVVDVDGDGQISFDELWNAIQQDRPQGMTEMMRNFVRLAGQGPQGGGMGMQGGMNGGGGGTLL
jgi:hypothetical protein